MLQFVLLCNKFGPTTDYRLPTTYYFSLRFFAPSLRLSAVNIDLQIEKRINFNQRGFALSK